MKINYNNKRFSPVQNTENGEITTKTIFKYKQNKNILTSVYSGGQIVSGHLIGLVDENSNIEMSYHKVNTNGEIYWNLTQNQNYYQMLKNPNLLKIGNGLLGTNLLENRFWRKFD